jgi:hypothetical protein
MSEPRPWRFPVPKLFWSEYHDAPFEHCVDCNGLLHDADLHLIQRAFVGTEPVFEFAICHRCHESMSEQCSEETGQAVVRFMQECLGRRATEIVELTTATDAFHKCVNECVACSRPRTECHRYSIGGLCVSDQLVIEIGLMTRSPVMICHECELSISELVSKKTRDTWNRFVEDHFDGPPGAGVDLPTGTPMLL